MLRKPMPKTSYAPQIMSRCSSSRRVELRPDSDWVLQATQALLGMGLQGKVVSEDNMRVVSFKSGALRSSIRPRRVELR